MEQAAWDLWLDLAPNPVPVYSAHCGQDNGADWHAGFARTIELTSNGIVSSPFDSILLILALFSVMYAAHRPSSMWMPMLVIAPVP